MLTTIKKEIKDTLDKSNLIWNLSWSEIKARYSRSILGPFWLVLTTAISVLGLGYVWSILFNQDKETFIPALCIGLVIWQFLSSCILESMNCFIINGSIIKNTINPILIFPIYTISKNFLIFGHNFIIVICILMIYPAELNLKTLLIIPGLILVLGNLIWICFTLALLGARYRDLFPAISSLMTILFFVSPVIYKPNQLGIQESIIWFNPFTYAISLIRAPLTGEASPLLAYIVSSITLLLGSTLLLYLLRYKYRIPYWL